MTFADAPVVRRAASWHQLNLDEWNRLTPRTQTRAKVTALVVLTVLAYHYSLASLLQTVGADTPLAYVGLVPLLAGGLAWVNRVPARPEPQIHDRQLDYTIGLPLVALSVLAEVVLPARLGAMFWVDRLDLLFLPVFVTGATILLFGVRVAWRQKVALAYLILAWPWLYTGILLGTLGGFTSLTVAGLNGALRVLPVAAPVPGGASEGLYEIVHHGHAFSVSVVTACSGVDSMVGFILIGAAFTAVASGSLLRKVLWLITGMVLLWVTNFLRLLVIFWAGRVGGEHLAIGILHPIAGLVMFCVGVAIMGLLLRPFGISPGQRAKSEPAHDATSATPRFFVVFGVLVAASLVSSASQATLRAFDPVAAASGTPRLGSFLADPAQPAGWTATFDAEYTANKPFFGESSRWFRYVYSAISPSQTSLHSSLPVIADVIDTDDLSSFDAYGVTACYSFHGFTLRDVENVHLADGITGQALSFTGGTPHQDWSLVYWIVPVETGQGTRYERVVLYLQSTPLARISVDGQRSVEAPGDPQQVRLGDDQRFLVAFADQVIVGQARQDDTDVLIDAVETPTARQAYWAAAANRNGEAEAPAGGADHGPTFAPRSAQFWARFNARGSRASAARGG
ncbi:MAG TPA: exosortase/archaeosortase family protein [Acidimicrobiales bacterium]|nr:exosortase/archaeosortase family protein [Acidimicrobiales bacterium]